MITVKLQPQRESISCAKWFELGSFHGCVSLANELSVFGFGW